MNFIPESWELYQFWTNFSGKFEKPKNLSDWFLHYWWSSEFLPEEGENLKLPCQCKVNAIQESVLRWGVPPRKLLLSIISDGLGPWMNASFCIKRPIWKLWVVLYCNIIYFHEFLEIFFGIIIEFCSSWLSISVKKKKQNWLARDLLLMLDGKLCMAGTLGDHIAG